MYRQNADFFIPDGTPKIVAKLIRHERYEQRKYHYMTVPYSDNILVANDPVDYQLIALRLAMERMKILYPSRFKVLYEFYFAEVISVRKFAEKYGISPQAMYKKLAKNLEILRKLAYSELDKLL
jgi:hypothetical protein